jgi:anhydro-N-acetylmuramic acid kinase
MQSVNSNDNNGRSPWSFLSQYAEKKERYIIGLMSGTSVDGIDAALVRLSGSERSTQADLEAFVTEPFSAELRKMILDISQGEGNAEAVSLLNTALGETFADAALAVYTKAGSHLPVDAIASHGQTISHTPSAKPFPATFQIGESAIIAQRLGIPVVSDFRAADMTAGGQGAPLVPYVDWCLLTHQTKSRAVQNIGGIGNVTFLTADASPGQVLGFDTGPGNMLIDAAASWFSDGALTFDKVGQIAASGDIDYDLLVWLLEHPFLRQVPPKSAGREEFGINFFNQEILPRQAQWSRNRAKDVVTTLTAFTAYSIFEAYRAFLPAMPDEVIIGGGGARNPTLMKMLQEKFGVIPVVTHEACNIDSETKEALAFAVLANETLLGKPANLPSVTGALKRVILGKITVP